jgi:hypothetical protein
MPMHIRLSQRPKKPYTLAGFKPGIFWSGGGRDDHHATPQGGIEFFRLGSVFKISELTYLTHVLIIKPVR